MFHNSVGSSIPQLGDMMEEENIKEQLLHKRRRVHRPEGWDAIDWNWASDGTADPV